MYFYSTNDKGLRATFRQAVLNGIAPDGGLYLPSDFPELNYFHGGGKLPGDFNEIAYEIAGHFVIDINNSDLQTIISEAFNFSIPLIELDDKNYILELFHGPTLAFKDFGARFLARILAKYVEYEAKKTVILVATSGDTGSAVASGFYGMDGIEVGLLYPGGMVSDIQEKQLTTMGGNIHAFEVEGTFDDCQMLVKKAFLDNDLKSEFNLSSANSINIARLIPQSFYYIYAWGQLENPGDDVMFCVPSGNFGNLTAGLFAWRMGIPVKRFLAAVNSNKAFPDYLGSGQFTPRKAKKTYSNAMDVGNPSNIFRILDLFDHSLASVRAQIFSDTVSDEETLQTIRDCYAENQYVLDPHGAVGMTVSSRYHKQRNKNQTIITLETAHPGKFADSVQKALNIDIEIPATLREAMERKKVAQKISTDYDDFRALVLEKFR